MEVERNREIFWTKIALNNLKKVHKFYVKNADKEVADQIVDEIFQTVKTLEHSNFIGQEEEDLKHLKSGHRYLVIGHNKIVYKLKSKKIYITHVFDTRQNPEKLK
jgi:toxin ParE1/3/4